MLGKIDLCLNLLDNGLRTLFPNQSPSHFSQNTQHNNTPLSSPEIQHAAALMRINHVGEICAQALYQAQAAATQNKALREKFLAAAKEEEAHLDWTRARINELGSHTSHLNPLWFMGATAIGLIAGKLGDKISLGFMAETEHQVEAHLASHLEKLPQNDHESRAIVLQMKEDEARHAADAMALGGVPLPSPIKLGMKACAKVMTSLAYHI